MPKETSVLDDSDSEISNSLLIRFQLKVRSYGLCPSPPGLYEKSKQNITRDIKIKNNLTIARGEGTVGRRVFRSYYKGYKDKTKGEGGSKGGRWVWLW